MILLAYKAADSGWSASFDWTYHVPIISMPNLGYWILGGIAGILSLFLVISGFCEKWSDRVEKFIENRLHFLLFLVYWTVFVVGYLKGIGSLVSNSQSNWLVESAFYVGFVLFLLIPAHYFRWRYGQRRQRRIPMPSHASEDGGDREEQHMEMSVHNEKPVEDERSEKPNPNHVQANLSLYQAFITMLSIFLGFLLTTITLISFLPQAQLVNLSLRRAMIWVLLAAYYVLVIVLVRTHRKNLREAKVFGLNCDSLNDKLITAGLGLISLSLSFIILAGGLSVLEAVLSGIAGVASVVYGYRKIREAKKVQR
jgi:hypothetical protein